MSYDQQMDVDALRASVERGEIDTVVVAFADHLGRLVGKRFDAQFFLDDMLDHGTHGCDYLLTVDMEMEVIEGYDFANWDRGYGDFHVVADPATLRPAAWADQTAIVLCDLHTPSGDAVPVAPRALLHRQLERLRLGGYAAFAASELEFYLYEDSYRAAHEAGHTGLRRAGWYSEDYHLLQGARIEPYVGAARRALRDSEIPVENSKGETGVGQHELNIRYTDVLAMADRHALMKHGMKELADRLGVSVTFMAKPHGDDAGNSCHIHLSLWDADGERNVFAAGDDRSEEFRWFLGGWMAHVQDFMVFYAPTVNSYKRFQDGSWAPTRIAWSNDNRTAGFRVVGEGSSLRIECRIPGADCNPYLAYTAAIASGFDGIENQIEPPAAFDGDAYSAESLERVPRTLRAANERFAASQVTRRLLGDSVVDHYAHYFDTEASAYEAAVTDWERQRYFERI